MKGDPKLPAIRYELRFITDQDSPFYGVELRNSLGWADWTWNPDYGSRSHPRAVWQCCMCGGNHDTDKCVWFGI